MGFVYVERLSKTSPTIFSFYEREIVSEEITLLFFFVMQKKTGQCLSTDQPSFV
jgi:hypothetical protein